MEGRCRRCERMTKRLNRDRHCGECAPVMERASRFLAIADELDERGDQRSGIVRQIARALVNPVTDRKKRAGQPGSVYSYYNDPD